MRTEYYIELDDGSPNATPTSPQRHRPSADPAVRGGGPVAGRGLPRQQAEDAAGSPTGGVPDGGTTPPGPPATASLPAPRLAALSQAVLQLHRGCRDWPGHQFDARAVETLAGVLPHSACLWGSTPQDAPAGAPPSVQGLFSQGLDGTTVGALLAGQGPAPGLQGQHVEPLAGRRVLLQLWRRAGQPPFDDADRQALDFLLPHLVEAQRENRLDQARHATAGGRPRRSLLLCDALGQLQQVDEHGLALLRQEWPRWLGRSLPNPLVAALQAHIQAQGQPPAAAGKAPEPGPAAGPDSRGDADAGADSSPPVPAYYGRVVTVLLARSGSLLLLDVRRRTAVDRLSHRQRDIARRYAGGQSGPQIAVALGLSSSTVNNHLGVIFKRLGVGSKLQLSELLRNEGEPRSAAP